MATTVKIPEVGEILFPDDVPASQIQSIIKQNIGKWQEEARSRRESTDRDLRSQLAQAKIEGIEAERELPEGKRVARLGQGITEQGIPQLKQTAAGAELTVINLGDKLRRSAASALRAPGKVVDLADRLGLPGKSIRENLPGRVLLDKAAEAVEPGNVVDEAAKEHFRKIEREAGQEVEQARLKGEQLGGGFEGQLIQDLGGTAVVSAPTIPAALVGGVAGAALTGGATSAGAMFNEAKSHLMKEGVNEDEAERRAALPALVAGGITTGVTKLFGATGIEAVASGTSAKTVPQLVGRIISGFGMEAAEETVDELGQAIVQWVSFDPDLINRPEEIKTRIMAAMGAGGVLGAATTGVFQTAALAENTRSEARARRDQKILDDVNSMVEEGRQINRSRIEADQEMTRATTETGRGFQGTPIVNIGEGGVVDSVTGEPLPESPDQGITQRIRSQEEVDAAMEEATAAALATAPQSPVTSAPDLDTPTTELTSEVDPELQRQIRKAREYLQFVQRTLMSGVDPDTKRRIKSNKQRQKWVQARNQAQARIQELESQVKESPATGDDGSELTINTDTDERAKVPKEDSPEASIEEPPPIDLFEKVEFESEEKVETPRGLRPTSYKPKQGGVTFVSEIVGNTAELTPEDVTSIEGAIKGRVGRSKEKWRNGRVLVVRDQNGDMRAYNVWESGQTEPTKKYRVFVGETTKSGKLRSRPLREFLEQGNEPVMIMRPRDIKSGPILMGNKVDNYDETVDNINIENAMESNREEIHNALIQGITTPEVGVEEGGPTDAFTDYVIDHPGLVEQLWESHESGQSEERLAEILVPLASEGSERGRALGMEIVRRFMDTTQGDQPIENIKEFRKSFTGGDFSLATTQEARTRVARNLTTLQKAGRWADAAIREGATKANIGGMDPKLALAAVVKGTVLIAEGVVNFGDWSGRMIAEHSETINILADKYKKNPNDVLKILWQAANDFEIGQVPARAVSAQIFYNREQLERVLARQDVAPDDKEFIKQVAGIQADLMPQFALDHLMGLLQKKFSSSGMTQSEKAQYNALKDSIDLVNLKYDTPMHQTDGLPEKHTDDEFLDAITSSDRRGIAANAVVHQHIRLISRLEKTKKVQDQKWLELSKIIGEFNSNDVQRSIDLKIEGDDFIRRYQEYLQALIVLKQGDPSRQANRLERLKGFSKAFGNLAKPVATTRALAGIAQTIPEELLSASNEEIVEWVNNWDKTTFDGKQIAGEQVWASLTTNPSDNEKSALENIENLGDELTIIREIYEKPMRARELIVEFKEWKNQTAKSRNTSLREFARDYAKLLNEQKALAAVIRKASRRAKAAYDAIQTQRSVENFLNQVIQDPGYKQKVAQASEEMNVELEDIKMLLPNTGQTVIKGPPVHPNPESETGDKVGREYDISIGPNAELEERNLDNVRQLIIDIEAFLSDPEIDPIAERTWRSWGLYLKNFLMDQSFKGHAGGKRERRWGFGLFALSPLEWDVAGPLQARRMTSQAVARQIGGRQGREMARLLDVIDRTSIKIGQLSQNERYGINAINNLAREAAASHGIDASNTDDVLGVWDTMVGEYIASRRQNATQREPRVGDRIPGGFTITKQDLKALDAQARWSRELVKIVEQQDSSLPADLRNAVKIVSGKISRNAFGQEGTMARSPSRDMVNLLRVWVERGGSEERLVEILSDPENFDRMALKYVIEGNPEFQRKSKHEKAYRSLTRQWLENGEYPDTLESLASAIAEEEAKGHVFDAGEAAAVQADLVEEIGILARSFVKHIGGLVSTARQDTEQFSEGLDTLLKDYNLTHKFRQVDTTTLTDTLMSMHSPFNNMTRPRVGLSAPSSWFEYTVTDENAKARMAGHGQSVFVLRTIDNLKALHKGIEEELDAINKQIKDAKLGLVGRHRFKMKLREEVIQGKRRADYFMLKRWQRSIQYLLAQNVTRSLAESADPESASLRFFNELVGNWSSSILASPVPSVNNVVGMYYAQPAALQAATGKTHFTVLPIQATKRLVSSIASKAIDVVSNHTPWLADYMRNNPQATNRIIRYMLDSQIRRQQKIAAAIHTGTYMPYDLKGNIEAKRLSPRDSGDMYHEHATALIRAASQAQNLPVLRQAVEVFKRMNPNSAFDRAAALENVEVALRQLDDLKLSLFEAFKSMDEAGDARPDVVLNKEELDMPRQTNVDNWRNLLSSIGTLEQIGFDYYQRTKDMHPDERMNESLFNNEDELNAAIFSLSRMAIQVRPESSRLPFAAGTGVSGFFRRLLVMFQTYASLWHDLVAHGQAVAGSDRQILDSLIKAARTSMETGSPEALQKAAGDISKGVWLALSTLMSFVLLGIFGREAGQYWRQLFSNEPPTGPRLGNVVRGANTPKEVAWYLSTSTAMLNPYYAEAIARMSGGTTGRAMALDVMEMVPALSLVRGVTESSTRLWQSGDPMALVDLQRKFIPMLNAAVNRIDIVEGDIQSRGAGRAMKAAAPPDIPVQQFTGSPGAFRSTDFTRIMRRLVAAANSGDTEKVRELYYQAVDYQRENGNAYPEAAVKQSLQSRLPERRVFGRLLTRSERDRVEERMTMDQKAWYEASNAAIDMIEQVIGDRLTRTAEDAATRTSGRGRQAPRTSRYTGSRSSRSRVRTRQQTR